MKMKPETTCNCHSYSKQNEGTPNVVLNVPGHILPFTDGRETVCIDACITDVICRLWDEGLPTLNSCCGHNELPPSVIIPEEAEPAVYLKALARIDNRGWVVSRWERVEYRERAEVMSDDITTTVKWPTPKDTTQGWKIDPEFICKVQGVIGYGEEDGIPSMEVVEAVLLAAAGIQVIEGEG